MSTLKFTVDCTKSIGDVPALAHAVMGNMAYNLLRTGVRLQKTLEGICEEPSRVFWSLTPVRSRL